MPPQPQPITERGLDQYDVGGGVAATVYTDGSVVFWKVAPPNEQVGYIPPGSTDPVDIGGGRAATLGPDQTPFVFEIANPPPEVAGTIPAGATPGQVPAPVAPVVNPRAPTGPVGTRLPGQDFNYGPSFGNYSPRFGSGTVSPATRNAAVPGEGRSAGWGSIGAGTEGIPFGWGVPGFGKDPIKIDPGNYAGLADATVTPGYIPGSGTYNQRDLSTPGLFGQVGGKLTNLAFGSGGVGDPTTGHELQTPERWVRGTGSTQAMQGDEYARGLRKLPGGGGYFQGGFQYPQSAFVGAMLPSSVPNSGGGYDDGYGSGGGWAQAGLTPYFGSTVTSNWGDTPETSGLGFIANLFLRSDTETGIGTPAWSAPPQMWQALANEIRAGRVFVKNPDAWQMLAEKGITPQSIGGAATGGRNVQPGGGTGADGGEADATANANAAAAADRAAYWAYQQSLLRQGDQRIAMEAARDAWTKEYQQASLTGKLNGEDTLAAQMQRAGLTGMFEGQPTMAREQMMFNQEMQKVANELAAAGLLGTYQGQQTLAAKAQEFSQAMQQRQFGLSEAGVTGMYQGQETLAARQLRDQTALGLMGLQAQLRGPRNWDSYQSTFASTPGGLRDVMAAFQGQYTLPGATGAQSTAQGGRATVSGLAGDILSGSYGQQGAGEQPAAVGNPYAADLRSWNRMQPSQREMVLGRYEGQGWHGDDVENMLRSAAPKYAGAGGANYALYR